MPLASTQLSVRHVNALTSIIDIHGKVTALTERALLDAYTQASGPTTRNFILNFSGLEYMNSAGIGLIVTLFSRVSAQRQRLLAFGLSKYHRHLFRLTRLERAITIHLTESEALAAVQAAEEGERLPDKERGRQ